jgi:hypothetical protein
MAERRERATARVNDFQGVIESADPGDIPSGASQMQVNVASRRVGLLESRPGFLPVAFETTTVVSDLTAD